MRSKKGDEIYGNQTRVKVVKNKVAPPFKQAEFDILYNQGISKESELISIGVEHDIVEKSGAWYSYDGTRIGQGKDNVREFLKEHPDMAEEIEARVRTALGVGDERPEAVASAKEAKTNDAKAKESDIKAAKEAKAAAKA